MANTNLANIIHHYGEIATMVNRREMTRFIQELRDRWNPYPEDEWEPHGEGYTDEGAFTLCVYQEAFTGLDPIRTFPDQLCEAERKNQVLLGRPVEDLVNEIDEPLSPPRPKAELEEKFSVMRKALQQQIDAQNIKLDTPIELPKDFMELMSITDRIYGAGVPAETAHLSLVYSLDLHGPKPHLSHMVAGRAPMEGERPLAAWKIGACTQHRNIYYVFCQTAKSQDGVISGAWKILDIGDVCDWVFYDNISEWLQKWTTYVEERPGGARIEIVVLYDRYPIH